MNKLKYIFTYSTNIVYSSSPVSEKNVIRRDLKVLSALHTIFFLLYCYYTKANAVLFCFNSVSNVICYKYVQ